jgi:nucleoside-diphosphate-sugar epimerase
MERNVLITGGAGFIGSHPARLLLTAGYRVRVLDNLIEQIHPGGERPPLVTALPLERTRSADLEVLA